MRRRRGAWLAPLLFAGCWSPATYRAAHWSAPALPDLLLPAPPSPRPLIEPPPPETARAEPIPTARALGAAGASALPMRPRPASAPPEEFAKDPRGDRWIQGRVTRVPVGSYCQWKLQYAPPEAQNPFAGAALLEGYVRDDLQNGDLVQAEGSFLPTNPGQPATYRCTAVAKVR